MSKKKKKFIILKPIFKSLDLLLSEILHATSRIREKIDEYLAKLLYFLITYI
jgi:hypothetical protein